MHTFVDLFCGIGGFHYAAASCGLQCVFACDIDAEARHAYESNFGLTPDGDITAVDADDIPDHDLLCAGFPCQPFSIIGDRRGFDDARGTLFFEIARIAEAKRPEAMILENVRQLATHNGGRTIGRICEVLDNLGYSAEWRIFDARNFGLPQKRERVVIVAMRDAAAFKRFEWPKGGVGMKPLSDILTKGRVDAEYYVSPRIRRKREESHKSPHKLAIWHENKGGNISSYPFSCALRAGASYNYLLVNGKRRLTEREMLRLQGFPEEFKIVCNYQQTRKQAGNAVPVPVIKTVAKEVVHARKQAETARQETRARPSLLLGLHPA